MAQKIVTLCDAHQLHEEEVAGESWEVTLRAPGASKATTWAIDLCPEDGKTLVDLGTMLDAAGRVTDGPRRKAPTAARNTPRTDVQAHAAPTATRGGAMAPVAVAHTPEGWPCPVDGCGKVSATRAGLQTHVRAYHQMSLAEATGAPLPYACDVAGCDRRFSHVQGLAAHRRNGHGLSRHASGEGTGAA